MIESEKVTVKDVSIGNVNLHLKKKRFDFLRCGNFVKINQVGPIRLFFFLKEGQDTNSAFLT